MIESVAGILIALVAAAFGALKVMNDQVERGRKFRRDMPRPRGYWLMPTAEREKVRRDYQRQLAAKAAAAKAARAAERRIVLALFFVPPGQRDRYRQEWCSEMAQLSPAEAASFALHLLLLTPRTGALLWLKRTFGRRLA